MHFKTLDRVRIKDKEQFLFEWGRHSKTLEDLVHSLEYFTIICDISNGLYRVAEHDTPNGYTFKRREIELWKTSEFYKQLAELLNSGEISK